MKHKPPFDIDSKSFFLQLACETFCLDDDDTLLEATSTLRSESLTAQNVRFIEAKLTSPAEGLARCHNKKVRLLITLS